MKTSIQTPKQQEILEALIQPMIGIVQLAIGLIMLIAIDPFRQPAETHAVEIFAIELVAMSVVVYFAVPAIGSKIVAHMRLRNRKEAAEQ